MKRLLLALSALLLALLGVAWSLDRSASPQPVATGTDVAAAMSGPAAPGYARAEAPRTFEFPADHGPHPDFRTEWWYLTGQLESAAGRVFGYQLTFFRTALAPPDDRPERSSPWAADQLYMAHFALTDVDGNRFFAFERFSRGALGLAGAEASPFRVWLDDWSLEGPALDNGAGEEPWPMTLHARARLESPDLDAVGARSPRPAERGAEATSKPAHQIRLDLVLEDPTLEDPTLADRGGRVLQGDRGYSRKGPEPGNASFYYSYPRLATHGTVEIAGETLAVTGSSWLDREWSTSALGPDLEGWDWFSLQLDDGRELMLFRLRRKDGARDPYDSGTLVRGPDTSRRLAGEDFEIEVTDRWTSPDGAAVYPSGWRLELPSEGLELEVEPLLRDQELRLSVRYWEGAVRVRGRSHGSEIGGRGYVELTGYATGARAPR